MRKYFLWGFVVIMAFAVGLVSYGAYLNYRGENKITERMAGRTIPLLGARAARRALCPRFAVDAVNFDSGAMADAVALIDGRVAAVHVKKNDHVAAGQLLVTLSNEELPIKIKEADSELLRAETELLRAKNNYSRYERLRARDATTAEKFDEAQAGYRAALAAVSAAEARKEELLVAQSRQSVAAPLAGEVLLLYRPAGAYVTAGTSLALIGDFRRLYFSLPAEDVLARKLSVGQEAVLEFGRREFQKVYDTEYEAGNAGKNQNFTVKISEISPPLSQTAAMRKITFEVDNGAGLLEPQTYSGVAIRSAVPHDCVAVPLAAMTAPARSSVFVVRADGTLERREVSCGADDGTYVEILTGLQPGEVVVVSGTEGLADGMKADVAIREGDA